MAAGLGYIEFTTGDILTAATANGYLASQTVMVFADAAARTAAITSPQEGMITYLKSTDAVEKYTGSAYVSVGGSSPLTTKGDVYTFSTVDARLAVGANGTILTADSAEATGLKWAAAASSGGMTSIASGSLTGSSLSLTSISGSYKNLQLILRNVNNSNAGGGISWTANSITSYTTLQQATSSASGFSAQVYSTVNGSNAPLMFDSYLTGNNTLTINVFDYADTTTHKVCSSLSKYIANVGGTPGQITNVQASINATAAITSLTVTLSAGSFSSGTYVLYGVN